MVLHGPVYSGGNMRCHEEFRLRKASFGQPEGDECLKADEVWLVWADMLLLDKG